LQGDFFFAFWEIHEIVGVQLPTEMQEFLLKAVHAHPQFAREAEVGEIIGTGGQRLDFPARGAKGGAIRWSLTAPARGGKGCGLRRVHIGGQN
jgi:hypothetical protein